MADLETGAVAGLDVTPSQSAKRIELEQTQLGNNQGLVVP